MKLTFTPRKYVCTCCGIEKLEKDFYVDTYTKKRTTQCKECVSIKRKVERSSRRHTKFVRSEKIRSMEDKVDYKLGDWRDAMIHFKGSCAFCGAKEGRAKSARLDRDHLLPLSLGGKATRYNIVPACQKCNRARGNKRWKDWYPRQPFYDKERARSLLQWEAGLDNRRIAAIIQSRKEEDTK